MQGEFGLFPTEWLGLNPGISHDFKNGGAAGYQPLAYFLTTRVKAGLNAGVDLGYRTEKKLGIRVFIGATFGLLP